MVDAVARFFDHLGTIQHEPLLEKSSGSLRFEIVDGDTTERWRVELRHGDITVSRKAAAADCLVRAPRALFVKLASGRENAMAAVLRSALTVEGDIDLLMAFQRILPGPPRRRVATRSTAGRATRRGG